MYFRSLTFVVEILYEYYFFADSQRKLIEDQFYIDPLSGILLYHLTFIMKHLFPYNMFCKELEINGPIFCSENVWYHILGSQTDESLVTLRDITRTRVVREKKKSGNGWVVVMKSETEAFFPNASMTHRHIPGQLFVESCNTHPGYCRLRLVSPSLPDSGEGDDQFGSNMYQKAFSVTNDLRSKIKLFKGYEIYCIGVQCLTYPFNNRWKESRKGFDFPSRFLVSSIIKTGCTLIPKSHPKSTSPEIEWQFDFSMAEHLIFKNLTQAQIHGFRIIKVMVENLVHHLPLNTKHIKSVFLMTCEEMASSDWETNFSGCILYVLDYFLSCLKSRFLPSYFIPEYNLIDCHREDDISTMCTLMEYIRLFPTNAIQIVVEKYGYTYGSNLIKRVLSIAKDFPEETKSHIGINKLFWPLTIATAKMMAKIGYYGVSLDILEQRYEQSLLLSDTDLTQTSVSFSDLFRLAIVEIRQKASRVLLSRSYRLRMGSNVPEMSPEEKECTLQTNIPWAVDSRIGWLKVPLENKGNLNVIASFLYDYSKLEYWRRNVVLVELAITTAIRCIQETLKNESIFVKDVKDSALKAEIDDQIKTLKKKLIPYYVHLYSISRIDYYVYPIIHYMEDIEKLCKEFPEIAGIVCEMFLYTRQPEKAAQYADKMTAYCRDKGKFMLDI